MHARQAFVTDTQAPELMGPGNAALHNPASLAQSAAVFRASFGKLAADAARLQFIAMRLRIVTTVALHVAGFALRTSRLAGDRRNRVRQRQQLGDVVSVVRYSIFGDA